MAKIVLSCKMCRKEIEREAKPEPKTKVEAKQILFNCPFCGATNLRDGSAYYSPKKAQKKTNSPAQEPANPGPGPAPAKPAPEPEKEPERNVENEEDDDDDSPLII